MLQSTKLVVAIIDPFKLDEVLDALRGVGAEPPTVTEARSYRRSGRTEIYRGAEYTPKFVSMAKIEIKAPTSQVDRVIEAIAGAAKSDHNGDARISVLSVEKEVRLRVLDNDRTPPRCAA